MNSSKNKFNLKSDRVNHVAPASHIECLFYSHNVRAMQHKLGPERLTRPVIQIFIKRNFRLAFAYLSEINKHESKSLLIRSEIILN